jgi:excisionase family DNA binding protein
MIKDFMTIGELRSYLGVSASTVYKLSANNLLPKFRPTGRRIYFLKSDVEAFMLKNRIASTDELNSQIDLETLNGGN